MPLRPAGRVVGAAAEEAEEQAGWRQADRGREGGAAAREGGDGLFRGLGLVYYWSAPRWFVSQIFLVKSCRFLKCQHNQNG